ncbi:MAG: GNAT family N-acetyltransferase [Thermoplasmata archaeon]|nr:GNAT family N-acetyltransferase [Thermoplasmata archaeon]
MNPLPALRVEELVGEAREQAVPILIESFEGIYRWHAKRTLRRVSVVRGARDGADLIGVSMLEDLAPGVGYVYYIAVDRAHRRHGAGAFLLDDAMDRFRSQRAEIVYAAAEEDNLPSLALFSGRGFRVVERDELGFQEGGLGAWGLRSKMMVVYGEVLVGVRINAPGTSIALVPAEVGSPPSKYSHG